jgi:hypothetical protein
MFFVFMRLRPEFFWLQLEMLRILSWILHAWRTDMTVQTDSTKSAGTTVHVTLFVPQLAALARSSGPGTLALVNDLVDVILALGIPSQVLSEAMTAREDLARAYVDSHETDSSVWLS